MELLPIIYWSLFGVGVLALLVILISFITFQFRKRYGNIPSQEIKGKERDKKIKVKNPDKKENTTKQHHPKVQTKSKKKNTANKNETIQQRTDEYSLYKKPTRDSKRKRVEILNPNLNKKTKFNDDTKYDSIKIESKHDGWN